MGAGRETGLEEATVNNKDYLGIMSLGRIIRRCTEAVKEKEGPKLPEWEILGVTARCSLILICMELLIFTSRGSRQVSCGLLTS